MCQLRIIARDAAITVASIQAREVAVLPGDTIHASRDRPFRETDRVGTDTRLNPGIFFNNSRITGQLFVYRSFFGWHNDTGIFKKEKSQPEPVKRDVR